MPNSIEWITIAAIVVGPIIAVLTTRWLDNKRDKQHRRHSVFRALMKTRAAKISFEHVDALNLVEIEFHNNPSVINSWKNYMENLRTTIPTNADQATSFLEKRGQLFIKLLQEIKKTIGLKGVDVTDLMSPNYYPVGWANDEEEQRQLRQLLISTFSGLKPINIKVSDPSTWNGPFPPAIPTNSASTPLKIEKRK